MESFNEHVLWLSLGFDCLCCKSTRVLVNTQGFETDRAGMCSLKKSGKLSLCLWMLLETESNNIEMSLLFDNSSLSFSDTVNSSSSSSSSSS